MSRQTGLDVFYSLAFKHELHLSFHDLVQLIPRTDEIGGKELPLCWKAQGDFGEGRQPPKYNMLTSCRAFYIRPCLHPPFGTLESFSANNNTIECQ